MPLIPVPNNPTWQQIQQGLVAAGREQADATGDKITANRELREAKAAVSAADAREAAATNNYNEWLASIRRLVFRPPG